MKRISKSMFRGVIAQPTSFKLCKMVQTYMLGMEPGSSTIPGGDTATHSGRRALPQVTFLWSAVSRETSRTGVLRVPFIVAFRSIFQKIHRTT